MQLGTSRGGGIHLSVPIALLSLYQYSSFCPNWSWGKQLNKDVICPGCVTNLLQLNKPMHTPSHAQSLDTTGGFAYVLKLAIFGATLLVGHVVAARTQPSGYIS